MRSTVIGWASRRRGALWGALVLLFAIVGTAGATAGAMLHLGVGNTTSATTTLRSGVNGTVLQVSNTNSTGGTSARGLGITVPAGRPPINVNATAGKATNLNADKLDGLDGAALQRRVTGSCAVGQVVVAIEADGDVACDEDRDTRVRIVHNTAAPGGDGMFDDGWFAVQVPRKAGQTLVGIAAEVRGRMPATCDTPGIARVAIGADQRVWEATRQWDDWQNSTFPSDDFGMLLAPASHRLMIAPSVDGPMWVNVNIRDGCPDEAQDFIFEQITIELIFVG